MEIKKLTFPKQDEGYLKNIFQRQEGKIGVESGSVILKKGTQLPFKTLEFHEISYLLSGKLKVSTQDEGEKIMNAGDMIYLSKEELRKTITLEDSKILFFLFKDLSSCITKLTIKCR